jgi:predicted secreted protein
MFSGDYFQKIAGLALCLGFMWAAAAWAAEGQPALTLTAKDAGKTFTMKPGASFMVELQQPSGTGYVMQPPVFEDRVLKLISHKENPPLQAGHPRVGFPIRHLFEFQAKGQGRTDLMVQIARPWEKDKAPLEVFRAAIVIRP